MMTEIHNKYALPIGAMVQEYRIIDILGTGSFGIVYKAENKYFSEIVALKEFLPLELAYRSKSDHRVQPLSSDTADTYQWARDKFLDEAKTLWELGRAHDHPNIVHVRQFIETNDTAYMVMTFEEGRPLSEILKIRGPLPQRELTPIIHALLDELDRVHAASVCHRDIKPSNILIRSDGSPVLIDFGAARRKMGGSDRSTISVFSPVYAALEQVSPIGEQGPWTDIYGLGVTLYQAITGKAPVTAAERIQGMDFTTAQTAAAGKYTPAFLAAVDAALGIYPQDRPQSVREWKAMFASVTDAKGDATVLRLPVKPSETGPWPTAGTLRLPSSRESKASRSLPGSGRSKFLRRPQLILLLTVVIAGFTAGWGLLRGNVPHNPAESHPVLPQRYSPPAPPAETADQSSPKANVESPGPPKTTVPVQARFLIASVPAKAKVFLNENFIGLTPLNTPADKGPHALRLHLDGYFDWEGTILVQGKDDIPLRIPLLKLLRTRE